MAKELAQANALEHRVPLPHVFWDGDTRMAWVATSWRELHDRGWNQRIQRLMVFGNLALGLGVDPRDRSGPDACPFTARSWHFVDRHAERFERHPRMAVIVNAWRTRAPGDRAATLDTAERYRDELP